MVRRMTRLALAIVLVTGCSNRALEDLPDAGDLAMPPDATAFDGTVLPDLGPTSPDLVQGPVDMACASLWPTADLGMCPCGDAGLCAPATGRLVVQTQSFGGTLRIRVMDDNGCRPFDVATDDPLGPPRWSPDGERIAYLTASGHSAHLHVLRVDGAGNVRCSMTPSTGTTATDLAWGAAPDQLWLYSPSDKQLTQFSLRTGVIAQSSLDALRFDSAGDGPLATTSSTCAGAACTYSVSTRPMTGSGKLVSLAQTSDKLGPVRFAPGGGSLVYEHDGPANTSGGFDIVTLAGGMPMTISEVGDRGPSFALGGHAIVHTTDDGKLRYHHLDGPAAGTATEIPAQGWKNVFGPAWAAPDIVCPSSDCVD